jgi:hypothetical protein
MSLRPDYRRIEEEVRLHLAELRAGGTSEADLLRAQELYAGLTAERLDDERLWAALFRVCGRFGAGRGWRLHRRGRSPPGGSGLEP